jgi:hypothetical protein
VGDSVDLIAPAKGLSAEEFTKKFSDWQNAVATASKAASSGTDTDRTKAHAEFSRIYNQRTEFMKEDETGFVWLYVRK